MSRTACHDEVDAARAVDDDDAHEQWERCFRYTRRGIAITDVDTNVLQRVNPAFAAMHGGTPEDFIGTHLTELFAADEREAAIERTREADAGTGLCFEAEHVRLDGTSFPVRVELNTDAPASGDGAYRIAWVDDLTAQRAIERASRDATLRFETAFANAPVGMAIVGRDGRWIKVNKAITRLTGYSSEELQALRVKDITHPDDLESDLDDVRRTVAGDIPGYEIEKRYITKRGDSVWVLLSVSMMHDEDGVPSYFISQIQDISAHKRMEARLRRLADHDALTDLWNRRRFDEELGRQVARCGRYGERAALLLIDLDGFKRINDTHGHKMGDAAIVAAAAAIRERIRAPDSVARIGGDEFVVLLANIGVDHALAVAEDLRARLAALTVCDGDPPANITASIGVTFLDEHIATTADPLALADEAMYRAKHAGRDRVAQ